MGATRHHSGRCWASVLGATLTIPAIAAEHPISGLVEGVSALAAHQSLKTSESSGIGSAYVSSGWMVYKDWQKDLERIRVNTPSLKIGLPLNENWYVQAGGLVDTISGATPRYHSAVSGASKMADRRRAFETHIERSSSDYSMGVGLGRSLENDFSSTSFSINGVMRSENRNRTIFFGGSHTVSEISSSTNSSIHEGRKSFEAVIGLTQIISSRDIFQVALWQSTSKGFLSDPYKLPDYRPRQRTQYALVSKWNHYLLPLKTPLRFYGRYYEDTYGIRSVTLQVEPVIRISEGLHIIPLIRLYSQDAAWFYYNPKYQYSGVPIPPGFVFQSNESISADQRLSAFGALTLGMKALIKINDKQLLQVSLNWYEQRTAWHWITKGSRGIEPLQSRFFNIQHSVSF